MLCSGGSILIDQSDGIADAQRMLRVRATGIWNKATNEAALKLLRSDLEKMGTATISYGDTGGAVKALQAGLNRYGHNLIIDGRFGVSTQAALVTFQVRHGLPVTAVADEDVFSKLFE